MFDNLPDKVRCFICLKPTCVDDNVSIVKVNAVDMSYAVIVCEDDFTWMEKNKEAGLALIKGRLFAMDKQKKNEEQRPPELPPLPPWLA